MTERVRPTSQLRKPLPQNPKRAKSRRQTADPTQFSMLEIKKALKDLSQIRKFAKQIKKQQQSGPSEIIDIKRVFTPTMLSTEPVSMADSAVAEPRLGIVKSFTEAGPNATVSTDPKQADGARSAVEDCGNSLKIWLGEDIPPIPKKKHKKKKKDANRPTSTKKKRSKTSKRAKSPVSPLTVANPTLQEPLFTNNSMISIPEMKTQGPLMQSPIGLSSATGSFASPVSTFQSPKGNSALAGGMMVPRPHTVARTLTENLYKSLQTPQPEPKPVQVHTETKGKVEKFKERVDLNRRTMQRKSIASLDEIRKLRGFEEKAARKIQKLFRRFVARKREARGRKKQSAPVISPTRQNTSRSKATSREPPKEEGTQKLESLLKAKIELRKKRIVKRERGTVSPTGETTKKEPIVPKMIPEKTPTHKEPPPKFSDKEPPANAPLRVEKEQKPPVSYRETPVTLPKAEELIQRAKQRRSESFRTHNLQRILTGGPKVGTANEKTVEEGGHRPDETHPKYRKLATFNPEDGGINAGISPKASEHRFSNAPQLTTPQFTQPEEIGESEPNEVPAEKSAGTTSMSVSNSGSFLEEIPITVAVGRRGDYLQWNLSFPEDEPDETSSMPPPTDQVQAEMLAFTLGKRDVAAYRVITFDRIPDRKLSKWAHIAALMPNCLAIFGVLSRTAPVFHLSPVHEKTYAGGQEVKEDLTAELIDSFVEDNHVKNSSASTTEIDTILKTLLMVAKTYPRCQSELETLAAISEPAAYGLARFLASDSKNPYKAVTVFSREMVDECFREVAKMFVTFRGVNGKKLVLSRPWAEDYSEVEWGRLLKRFVTSLSPICGNPVAPIAKRSKRESWGTSGNGNTSKFFGSKRSETSSKGGAMDQQVKSSERKDSMLELTNWDLGHGKPMMGPEGDDTSQEISSLEDLLEPMRGLESGKREATENTNGGIVVTQSERGSPEVIMDEYEKKMKAKEAVLGERHHAVHIFKRSDDAFLRRRHKQQNNSEVLEQGTVGLFGVKTLVSLSVVAGPIIENLNEINDLEKALEVAATSPHKLEERPPKSGTPSEVSHPSSPHSVKFSTDFKRSDDFKAKFWLRFIQPLDPEEVFCTPRGVTEMTLYMSFGEFVKLMSSPRKPEFEVIEFLKYGKLRSRDRVRFYHSVASKAYQVFGKIYLGASDSQHPIGENNPIGHPSNTSWFTEPGVSSKKPQVSYMKANSLWETPKYDTLISSKLSKFGVPETAKGGTEHRLLGHECGLNGGRYYLSFCLSFYGADSGPYMVATFSSPHRGMSDQRIYMTDKAVLSNILSLLEKCRENRRDKLLPIILPQTISVCPRIHGDSFAVCSPSRSSSVSFSASGKCRRNLLMDPSPTLIRGSYLNHPDIGPCFLAISELSLPPSMGITKKSSTSPTWTYSLDHVPKSYRTSSDRVWKLSVFQKDTMRHFDLLVSDADFQGIYPHFTKSEKVFFELFGSGAGCLKKAQKVQCLAVLGQKVGFRRTEVGSIMVIDTNRRPVSEGASLYVPLREFVRQRTVEGDGCYTKMVQHGTNARHPVLQTTIKHAGRYINLTVYYMIPLNSWKIKLRVTATGRTFIADVDAGTFAVINKKIESQQQQQSSSRRPSGFLRPSPKSSSENVAEAVGMPEVPEVEVRSMPKSVALRIHRRSKQPITPTLVQNSLFRERVNLKSEPEPLTEKKRVISSWTRLVSSFGFSKCDSTQWGLMVDEESLVPLHEILYDSVDYSAEDKAFIYAEVELKYSPVTTKASPKDKIGASGGATQTPGLTEALPGVHKNKLSDYVLIITTIHLPTKTRKQLDPRLDMVMAKMQNYSTSAGNSATMIPYEQLKNFAAKYVKEEIKKHSAAAAAICGGEEVDNSGATGGFGVVDNNGGGSKTGAGVQQQPQKPIMERKMLYEGMIQTDPKVVGKVLVCRGTGQVVLKINGMGNDVNYEIPISFQQAAKDCLFPVQLLYKDYHWIGQRVLEGYREVMLKQYYGLYPDTPSAGKS